MIVTNSYGCQSFDAIKLTFNNGPTHNSSRPLDLSSSVKIYPNPVSNELNVTINRIRNSEVILTMTDILGNNKLVSKEMAGYGYNKKVDMQSLPAGIYLIRVEYDGEINTTRIIKQ